MTVLSTGTEAINNLLYGGLPVGAITSIYGKPNLGKSFFAAQMCVMANRAKKDGGLDSPSLILDTENMFGDPLTNKRIFGFFLNRWYIKEEDLRVDIERVTNVQNLLKLLGVALSIDYGKKGKKLKIEGLKIKPLVDSKIYQKFVEQEYKFMVVDSFSQALKVQVVSTEMQNFGARATLENILFGRLQEIAEKFNASILLTHHITKDPTKFMQYGEPFGGDMVQYNSKYTLQTLKGTKELTEVYGREVRRIRRKRAPWMGLEDVAIVKLELDVGYVDVAKGGKK